MFSEVVIAPVLMHANESSGWIYRNLYTPLHTLFLQCGLTSIFILVLLSNSYLIHMLIATITIK